MIAPELCQLMARYNRWMNEHPCTLVAVLQLFNHGAHHRGQITTRLNQTGHDAGATDIPWLPGLVRIIDTP